MSSGEKAQGKEPFYFKSFDRVIGIARNVEELKSELERLINVDPKALEYHLREGHIVQWLVYIGEVELAKRLIGVGDPKRALEIVSEYLSSRGREGKPEEKEGEVEEGPGESHL
ncbi:hypothetical protein [Vulcanisaeta sp. JCM 16159]|uniref:hypothetical protein n=1 Tax=Vulcanisaeta sp. JCM 16159 TaxID=1295371 RepID=UPI0006D21BAD|nr:hypothetical protein [Vulcanisaeta sp. JCM 16159]